MEEFSAESLKLKPEHLRNLRPVDTDALKSKQRGRKRDFAQITRDQFNRLTKATNAASWKIFLHLLFLNWQNPGRAIRLANGVLREIGVTRYTKYRALPELKKLGLIKMRKKRGRKSPEIIVR
jgi:hypothetical protein